MASIDERIVSMSFENQKFEAGVAKTMATLTKLNDSLKKIGSTSGLSDLDKQANKVTFSGLSSATDKLKDKLNFSGVTQGFSNIQNAASKISFGPLGTAVDSIKSRLGSVFGGISGAIDTVSSKLHFPGAAKGFTDLESASQAVKLTGPNNAADGVSKKLQFPGAEAGFATIEKASSRVTLGGMSSAVQSVTTHLSTMQIAGVAALAGIATRAVSAGIQVVKSFTIDPVTDGFHNYETQINAIQTILANTGLKGSKGMAQVNKVLAELNTYANKTVYNFSEMTKNIGTFTAAGVDLKTSANAIKGIANLAALSGSNSEQASTAMYQLSQAIAAGKVNLQDWNSVVNAGLGGSIFQRALAETAVKMGTLKDSSLKLVGPMKQVQINGESFRQALSVKPGEKSWLTSGVLTTALGHFTGDLTDAQLKAQGFNKAQIAAIQNTAKLANDSATKIKTLSQLTQALKEEVGTAFAAVFKTVFGNISEAKAFFSPLHQSLENALTLPIYHFNTLLQGAFKLGGKKDLLDGIRNALGDLDNIIKPIHDAFLEIFPAATSKSIFNLLQEFDNLTKSLHTGKATADETKRTFAGVFAVLDIGKQFLGGVVSGFGELFKSAQEGSSSFLGITGGVGDFLVALDQAIKKGDIFKKFFVGLADIIRVPLGLLGQLAGVISGLFKGSDKNSSDGVSQSLDNVNASLHPLKVVLDAVTGAWKSFTSALGSGQGILGKLGKVIDDFAKTVEHDITTGNFSGVFQAIQTTLIGGIFLTIHKALGGGTTVDLTSGLTKNLSKSFELLNGSLVNLQKTVKAATLLTIATAVGVLTASIVALSLIKSANLVKATGAITASFTELLAAMSIMTKISKGGGLVQLTVMAADMNLLASAIDILSIAVIVLGHLSWSQIEKGLTGVGGALVAIGVGVRAIPKDIILIGPGLLPLAVALNIIAVAVKIFATMKWEQIGKGLAGIAGSLVAIGAAMQIMPADILVTGPGLLIVAAALTLLSGAVLAFGKMDLKTIAKGIAGIGASLVVIGLAIDTIPPTVALQAAGLVILSVALTGIAAAIKLMGSMSIAEIAKGLAGIGASLVILAGGLTIMSGTLPGSAALLTAAAGLAILVPVIGILGTMKFSTIAKGLGAIAATLTVLGVVGIAAGPGLVTLGVGLAAIGSAVGVTGAGVYLLAKGLSLLGGNGTKGVAVLIASLTALVAVIPKVVVDFFKGMVQILASIAALAPQVVASMVKIINSMLDVVIQASPKMAVAAEALIAAILKVLNDKGADIINAGWQLLLELIKGVADHIGEVVTLTGDIIANFLIGIANAIPKIISAGAFLLTSFLIGVAQNIGDVVDSAADVIVNFLNGVANNIARVVTAGAHVLEQFIVGLTANIDELINKGVDFLVKLIDGVSDKDNLAKLAKAGVNAAGNFIDAVAGELPRLADKGAEGVSKFVKGVADGVPHYAKEINQAAGSLIAALSIAMIAGIPNLVTGFISELGSQLKNAAKSVPVVGKLFRSAVITTDVTTDTDTSTLATTADDITDQLKTALAGLPAMLEGLLDLNPTITPVLDLSDVQTGVLELSQMFANVTPIYAAASFGQAAAISAEQQAAQTSPDVTNPIVPPAPITFEQNNYSPEALSTADIYRQTNNQLAQAKKSLGIAS